LHYFKDKPGHRSPKKTRKLQEIKISLTTFQQCRVLSSKHIHLAVGLKQGTKITHQEGTVVITHREIRILMQPLHSYVITKKGRNVSQHSRCHTMGCCREKWWAAVIKSDTMD